MKVVLAVIVVLVGLVVLGKVFQALYENSLTPEEKATQHHLDERIGAASKVAQVLKRSMRDPDSFKLTSVRIIDKSNAVCYEYSARNGFGGINASRAVLSATGELKTEGMKGFAKLWNKECQQKYFEEASAVTLMADHLLPQN